MKILKGFFTVVLLSVLIACTEDSVSTPVEDETGFQTPEQIVPKITRGINIGNTLEAPFEGEWYPQPLREYYFDDIKTAGFTCVRIPVRWDKHTSESAPYDIDEEWMSRVEQVVDWGLARGLYLIVNAHHEGWLKENYNEPGVKERFHAIWRQISENFKDKSGKLMFEMINEPEGLTVGEVDEVNRDVLAIIREANPQRIVIFGGNSWSNAEQLFTAAVPDDDYLMAYYHSYDPWDFAGVGNGTWGNFDQREAVRIKFSQVKQWADTYNIPVMISEFGAVTRCDYNSRMLHYYAYVDYSLQCNIPFMVWDDGGDFSIYDRENRTWSDVKDILINTYIDGPFDLRGYYANGNNVYLAWSNRTESTGQIIIQRKTEFGEFTDLEVLNPDVIQFHEKYYDSGILYYRIILRQEGSPDKYSNPVKIVIP
ncbi:MAG: hypothetical protein SCALA702_04300 [Melioribacteraceae bacterium]|nr:MAG: hypothetical protein SCALA702_04300 [Melioribacteraceae bacterium]